VPVQAVLQQTPSAQDPLAHSPPIAHELPIGLPGASMPTSAGRSTDTSPGDPSVGASPAAESRATSGPASTTRCSPPPPHPAIHATAPRVTVTRTRWWIRA
jgi:hypothetical protein